MFLGYVLSFVDEASEGEVSTFAIIFRIRFPTLVCYLKCKHFLSRLSPSKYIVEPKERVPETIICPLGR